MDICDDPAIAEIAELASTPCLQGLGKKELIKAILLLLFEKQP